MSALVNQTCRRVFGPSLPKAERREILVQAATAMREVLVDRERRHPSTERKLDLLALNTLLEELATFDPLMTRCVDLHFFAGMAIEETAEVLGVPLRSFERRWRSTKAWLRSRLG